MRLAGLPGRPHLTYGLNVHPGEDVPAVIDALRAAGAVRRALVATGSIGSATPFGVGLRLAGAAAKVLDGNEAARRTVSAVLGEELLYAFTVNAFPHGAFHRGRVKEAVYEPDWLDPRRADYTLESARVLAALVDEHADGLATVSTVPIAFASRAASAGARQRAGGLLRECAGELARLRQRTGVRVVVALEPEPACAAETTAEAIAFLEEHVFARGGDAAREHVGLCVDLCHAAVVGEDPDHALLAPERAGIELAKVQISAALDVALSGGGDESAVIERLGTFDDGVYLHQVVEDGPTGTRAFVDLPDALAALAEARRAGDRSRRRWRVHAHVPVFLDRAGELETTQPSLLVALDRLRRRALAPHLEIETYTWDVLPDGARGASLVEDVARELTWTLGRLGGEAR